MSRARRVLGGGRVAAAAVALAGLIGIRDARACGGFFCSTPPPDGTLPIAQAAENVLFVMKSDQSGSSVEAHIQILYTGPATTFSWIVPVTAVPTVDVGWDILFDRIEPPTRPSFQLSYVQDGTCQGFGGGDSVGCGEVDYAPASSGAQDGGSIAPPPMVDVLSRGSIGPYEYVVVRSEDGGTLRTWLTTNGYYVSEEGARIVDEYVAGGHSFVAVKLQQGQGTSAIRPIILRLPSVEACLPLKLTAIASTPDLRINVWVLAAARAVPINYVEIAVNQAKLDWFNGGQNYDQLLKEAANEAEGNAFAVEFAQPASTGATWFTAPNPGLRAALPSQADPPSYLNALASIGLRPTGAIMQIVREYIPLPAALAAQGVTEASFYGQISFYWANNRDAFAPFDPVAMTAELEAEVLVPMDSFGAMFRSNRYLTRLATFISPEEMTKDPLFVPNRMLPDVAPRRTAIGRVLCGDEEFSACSAPVQIELDDGRKVLYPSGACGRSPGSSGPIIDGMPSADVAWTRDPDSEGQVVLDNRATIMQSLTAHNATVATPGSGCGCALRARPRSMATIGAVVASLLVLTFRRRSRRTNSSPEVRGPRSEAP